MFRIYMLHIKLLINFLFKMNAYGTYFFFTKDIKFLKLGCLRSYPLVAYYLVSTEVWHEEIYIKCVWSPIMAIVMLQSEWKIYRNYFKQYATNQKIMEIFFYIFKIYNEQISIGKTYVGNIYVAYLSVDLKMDIIDVT